MKPTQTSSQTALEHIEEAQHYFQKLVDQNTHNMGCKTLVYTSLMLAQCDALQNDTKELVEFTDWLLDWFRDFCSNEEFDNE